MTDKEFNDALVEALKKEKADYEVYGKADRASDVQKEIDRIVGKKPKTEKKKGE